MADISPPDHKIEIKEEVSNEMESNSTPPNHEIERENASNQNKLKDDLLVTSINGMLQRLPPLPSEWCIYKVPRRLRKINEKAYTPQFVSIGPFHHGTDYLLIMEAYKLRYLKAFLDWSGRSLEYCLHLAKMWEQEVRNCYAETFDQLSSEFVKMILVDGTFLVELLLGLKEGDDIFHRIGFMNSHAIDDMMLLENQLPFFVLERFFDLVPNKTYSLLELTRDMFDNFAPKAPPPKSLPDKFSQIIKHFVDFLHCGCVSSIPKEEEQKSSIPEVRSWSNAPSSVTKQFVDKAKVECKGTDIGIKHFVDFLHRGWVSSIPKVEGKGQYNRKYERPPSVTKLHQAGVKFKKGTGISLFDIKFTNGVLEIPQLCIEDTTESLFRNLISYEQCHTKFTYSHNAYTRIFSDYIGLLDDLIDTSNDADLLIHCGIIESMLSSSEEVSALFNSFSKEVMFNSSDCYFSSLSQQLNAYCKSPRHQWTAALRRDYFNTPWAGISFGAALFLLVLATIQSVCSIISL